MKRCSLFQGFADRNHRALAYTWRLVWTPVGWIWKREAAVPVTPAQAVAAREEGKRAVEAYDDRALDDALRYYLLWRLCRKIRRPRFKPAPRPAPSLDSVPARIAHWCRTLDYAECAPLLPAPRAARAPAAAREVGQGPDRRRADDRRRAWPPYPSPFADDDGGSGQPREAGSRRRPQERAAVTEAEMEAMVDGRSTTSACSFRRRARGRDEVSGERGRGRDRPSRPRPPRGDGAGRGPVPPKAG